MSSWSWPARGASSVNGWSRSSTPESGALAGAVAALEPAQAALGPPGVQVDRRAVVHLGRARGAVAGIGQDLEPLLQDRLAASLAEAEGAAVEPAERRRGSRRRMYSSFSKRVAFSSCMILLGAEVGEVHRGVRQVAARLAAEPGAGLLLQALEVAPDPPVHRLAGSPELLHPLRGHRHDRLSRPVARATLQLTRPMPVARSETEPRRRRLRRTIPGARMSDERRAGAIGRLGR